MILSSEMHFTHFINAGSPSHVPNHVQLQSYQKLGAECKHQNPKRLLDHCLLDVLSSFFLFLIYTIVVSSMIIKNNRILKKKRKIFFLTSLEKDNPLLSLSLSLSYALLQEMQFLTLRIQIQSNPKLSDLTRLSLEFGLSEFFSLAQ